MQANNETLNAMAVPDRQPALLFFNKANGIWLNAIPYVDPQTLGGHDHLTFVAADMSMTEDTVIGEYPDFKVIAKSDIPPTVTESQLDAAMSAKITVRYPVVQQVNVLGRALLKLAEIHGITAELSELNEMLSYIDLCKDNNRTQKEFYRESTEYSYITNAELADLESSRFEGGLHEALGPRTISGGTVF